jgi:hypothetical protein
MVDHFQQVERAARFFLINQISVRSLINTKKREWSSRSSRTTYPRGATFTLLWRFFSFFTGAIAPPINAE